MKAATLIFFGFLLLMAGLFFIPSHTPLVGKDGEVSSARVGLPFFRLASLARQDIPLLDAPPELSQTDPSAVPAQSPASAAVPSLTDQQSEPGVFPYAEVQGEFRAFYLTAWVAGIPSRLDALIAKAKRAGINAFVIDVKDYSGFVAYPTDFALVKEAGADRQVRIIDVQDVLHKLHENDIYAIARVTVFQDPVLAASHPEWAIHDKETGAVWRDDKGLAWMDPAARPVWDYTVAIAHDAIARGFDEVNFDYIRFPSDGTLARAVYPVWDGVMPKHAVIKEFFHYVHAAMRSTPISADLFGLVTVEDTDLGIGQLLEDTYGYFDYVSPMVYPSHYSAGFLGYKNPAQYPYEVVRHSMAYASRKFTRAAAAVSTHVADAAVPMCKTKLRPWFQAFDLGAVYDGAMIRKQIEASQNALKDTPDFNGGWLLWDPGNTYNSYAP